MAHEASGEFDESILDEEYIQRKVTLATRVAKNRAERMRLRQELAAYEQLEKTGERPMEDPTIRTAVLHLESNLTSEMARQEKLTSRHQELGQMIAEANAQIRNIANLIQKQKEDQPPQIMLEAQRLHLQERKQQLEATVKAKKARLEGMKEELAKLQKSQAAKDQQEAVVSYVTAWWNGETLAEGAEPFLQEAHQLYKSASQAWQEARYARDQQELGDFYVQSWKGLMAAVDMYCLLINHAKGEQVDPTTLEEKVKVLYDNKIVVGTQLLTKLQAVAEKVESGDLEAVGEINPDETYEFLLKNMTSLKIA